MNDLKKIKTLFFIYKKLAPLAKWNIIQKTFTSYEDAEKFILEKGVKGEFFKIEKVSEIVVG